MILYCSHHRYSLTHCTSFHSPHFSKTALGKVTMEHDTDNSVTLLLPVLSFVYPSIAAPSAQFIQARNYRPILDSHLFFSHLLVLSPEFLLHEFLPRETQLVSRSSGLPSPRDICNNLLTPLRPSPALW